MTNQMKQEKRYCLVDTWNGGRGSKVIKFEGTYNECIEWIHTHTSFSFYEAITRQGYKVEEIEYED